MIQIEYHKKGRCIVMGKDRIQLRIAYTGEAVDGGTMDIAVLGPALIAFSKLINEANKVLHQDDSKIHVNVNADFKRGSFEIQLDVIRTVVEQIQNLFIVDTKVDDIVHYLGIWALCKEVSGVPSLIDMIKWVKNRYIDKIVKHDDETSTVYIEKETLTVPDKVIDLFTSSGIRESLQDIVKPTQVEGIDAFEVRSYIDKNTPIQRITKEESNSFMYNYGINKNIEEPIVQTYIQWARILTVNFEDLKWKFQSGDSKFHAKIEDEQFLKQIEEGMSFTKGDMLQLELEITQQLKPDGNVKNDYRVIQVITIHKRPKATTLPFTDNTPT